MGNLTPGDRGYLGASLKENMAAFDRLPKALRAALAAADHNYSAAQLARVRRNKRHAGHKQVATIEMAVAYIKQSDKVKHLTDSARGLVAPMFGQ